MNRPSPSDTDKLIEPRRDYTADSLRRSDLDAEPQDQFARWLKDARDHKIIDATAMNLCTVDSTGQPHSRIVLLKRFDENGFVWFTYQESDKANQLAQNPKAALLFYWCALERQIRIEGSVEKLNADQADEYFYSRPEGSRFSAAASVQSSPIRDRQVLEKRVAQLREQYPDGNVPRPELWGGYRLTANRFEFWQGRSDRLHDRFIYTHESAQNAWHIDRLSP
ncbi:MAG: pyridoxamine 5'-phosphate oxidase [Granulosicoccus sp.]|nr:pyridoxamine 5'-phosphate oxidase [Granulosicoccus sp.]